MCQAVSNTLSDQTGGGTYCAEGAVRLSLFLYAGFSVLSRLPCSSLSQEFGNRLMHIKETIEKKRQKKKKESN